MRRILEMSTPKASFNSICVFCGSKDSKTTSVYRETTVKLGQEFVKRGIRLVYQKKLY